jgi:histidinol-phosphatase
VSLDLARELEIAHALADVADAITLPHFASRSFTVSIKENDTEVTEIDRSTETALMEVVARERPTHARYGEEHGAAGDVGADFTWVIDPIDGTSNYVRGVPVWATLIGLVHRDMGPVLGFVSAPAMNSRWWGVLEGGAYMNGRPIRSSDVATLAEASLSIVGEASWYEAGRRDEIVALKKSVKRVRGYGDFWQHMLVAEGAIDIAVDAIGLGPYDIAALIPIVQEAGGRLVDRRGEVNWQGDTAVTTNGPLATAVRTFARP